MAGRGPVGKHPDRKHRYVSKQEREQVVELPRTELEWPEVPADWHDAAARWFRSLAESGQSVDYAPSDVMTAYIVAENMSRALADDRPINGNLLRSFLQASDMLLATAGSRRRVRMEMAPSTGGPDEHRDAAVLSIRDRRRDGDGA